MLGFDNVFTNIISFLFYRWRKCMPLTIPLKKENKNSMLCSRHLNKSWKQRDSFSFLLALAISHAFLALLHQLNQLDFHTAPWLQQGRQTGGPSTENKLTTLTLHGRIQALFHRRTKFHLPHTEQIIIIFCSNLKKKKKVPATVIHEEPAFTVKLIDSHLAEEEGWKNTEVFFLASLKCKPKLHWSVQARQNWDPSTKTYVSIQ